MKQKSEYAKSVFLLSIVLGLFFILSCAPSLKHYPRINQHLLKQDYDGAYEVVHKSKDTYAERNAVLYYLDEGIIAHFGSRFEESNQSLSRGEILIEDLYTKSISKEAASFLISDNTVPYQGEDFERAMVNLFMALNYVGMESWEDALVEARRVDNVLSIINSRYEEDAKNVYKEDGFIRYLMGILYETEDEINDAYITFKKAEEIYQEDYLPNYGVSPPAFLIEDLMSTTQAMGFELELSEIKRRYPYIVYMDPAEKRTNAEVFFIHYNGTGPEKVEQNFFVPMPDGFIIKIAYPAFQKTGYRISRSEIVLRNLESGQPYRCSTVLMEDIASIAIKNLENRIARIKAKAIARATAKYLTSKGAEKTAEDKGGALAGLLTKTVANIASVTTEQADVRHWRLLPAEIRVGRVILPPGKYQGSITFRGSDGSAVRSLAIAPFSVSKEHKRFFRFRTLQ